MFPKPAIEALRGSARPGRGHASDAKRIGTRTKRAYGDSKLYNTIVKVPARLNLKQLATVLPG